MGRIRKYVLVLVEKVWHWGSAYTRPSLYLVHADQDIKLLATAQDHACLLPDRIIEE